MTEIYVNESLKIIQDKKNNTMFKIEFNYACPSLVRSLMKTHIIKGGTISEDYLTLRFKANEVVSFHRFCEKHKVERGSKVLSINSAANMLSSLSSQLNYLIIKENKTILGYAPKNIIVINGEISAFLDSELVIDIVPEEGEAMAIISSPFNVKDFFVSPELLRIKELPAYVHYKTSYFSLGCLLLFALTEGSGALTEGSVALTEDKSGCNFYNEYLKELNCNKIHESLFRLHFKGTKFYWLLSRCLVEEPEKRAILFI
jgi:hypothetical protein